MHDLSDLIGLTWSQASALLSARGIGPESIVILDITPERAPRTPTQQFGWGEARVLRARAQEGGVSLTVAREMEALSTAA